MNNRKRKILCGGIIILTAIFLYCVYWAFYDIQRIKGQEIIQKIDSPDKTYEITAYLNDGGATTGYAVLCSVKINASGKEKNIYWNYPCEKAAIRWLDNQTAEINGIELNVLKDTYDYRHD